MFKDEAEEAVKLFESSKARLEKSEKESRGDETLDKNKMRGKMRRIMLNIVRKQTEMMNKDLDEGNLNSAESHRMVIEKLISDLKPRG